MSAQDCSIKSVLSIAQLRAHHARASKTRKAAQMLDLLRLYQSLERLFFSLSLPALVLHTAVGD